MSDISPASSPSPEPSTPTGSSGDLPRAVASVEPTGGSRSRFWTFAILLLALAGAAGTALLWQKISLIQEELARRSTDTGTQAMEARTLARQAQESTRELSARLLSTETRLSEVSLQRNQLEDLMRSLSRSRDDNLVIDLEAGLRLAQQQAQLTGSVEPLLAALKTAEQRLLRAAQPRLTPVQRALAKDSERIKSAALTDVPALLIKIDELVRLVDDLPLVNDMAQPLGSPAAVGGAADAKPLAAAKSAAAPSAATSAPVSVWRFWELPALRDWSQSAWLGLRDEARGLLRVSRIDRPEAALLAPEQSYFLRENIKLKLLNARLALLSRQTEASRSDLASVQTSLQRYFDASSRKTQVATNLLQQVQAQLRTSDLPRLDETLAALATAASGR
jgi:uroporphyrin-3 C-methyltransferase